MTKGKKGFGMINIMNWKKIDNLQVLNQIKEESKNHPVLIFKHSTRCSISSMALNRIERSWQDDEMKSIQPYYLDLITYRDISNEIANEFGVYHQSPQVIVIKDGKAVYDNSHMGISYDELKQFN